jgi:uncharacterized surface protein with fasciclin (FAS1) repeats
MPKFSIALLALLLSAGAAAAQTPPAPVAPPAPVTPALPVVTPAGDVIETLKASGQFTTFLKASDLVGLTAFVKGLPAVTVLAPADAAFAQLPAGELDRLLAQANRAELQKLVLRHLINARVPFETFKGAVTSAPTLGGEVVELNGDQPASVGGAPVVQADVMAANGVVHVLGLVISAPAP